MRTKFVALALAGALGVVLGASSFAAPVAPTPAAAQESDSGRVIVKFQPGATLADVGGALDGADVEATSSTGTSRLVIADVQDSQTAADAAAELATNPDVQWAVPDGKVSVLLTPNDTQYGSQWHFPQIGLPAAWNTTTGNANVIVAVVDTGVMLTHPDLDGKITSGANAGTDTVGAGDSDPTDDHGHGTFVAGIIGAESNNGAWVAGVCWACKIMPVKVLASDGTGWNSDVVEGIDWAVSHGADVINLSLGSTTPDPALEAAIDAAWNAGVIVVAASGNSNGPVFYPAAYANAIAVGANDSSGNRWASSNYGPELDIMAPGAGVYSTVLGGGYGSGSGTSFASPHVAGVVGLMISAGITNKNTIVNNLKFGATDMGAAGFDNLTAWGRVNAALAVDGTLPAASVTAPANGAVVNGTASTLSASASDASGIKRVEFSVDSTLVATDTAAPYSTTWNTTLFSDGPHTLHAKAFDNAGNIRDVTASVTVANNDTTQPTASITAPANGATVSGASVAFNATASDNVGVSKVRFWVDGTYLGYDSVAPYSRTWDTTAFLNGKHTLKIEALDAANNSRVVTSSVTVINPDSTPPVVSISAPLDGATLAGTIGITADASDTQGLAKVQFWMDGVYLGFDSAAPYTRTLDTTAYFNGTHIIKARAVDWGNNTTEAIITVTVDNADSTPPTATITAPLDGATVSGTVNITASASDNLGVSKVRFWVDGTYLGFDSAAPYTRSWNSASVANGAHTLRVQAVDNAGNVSSDDTITVNVSN